MSEVEAAPDGAEQSTLHGLACEDVRGATVVHTDVARYQKLLEALKAEGCAFCADLCAVDHLLNATRTLPAGVEAQRFEVVVNLRRADRSLVRVRCQVPQAEPSIPSLFSLWPGTEAMEREAYDLFGILFDGHPDLTRILMPEDWEGHPLRKDYAQGKVPVQFKAAAQTR